MASNKLEIIYGGFFAKYRGHTVETVKRVLQHLEHKRIAKIDTAAVYAESEEFLGLAGAANHFKIDTKFCGGLSELEPSRELVVKSCLESLSKLQTNCVDVFYIHAPYRGVPVERILYGINDLYKEGKFKRFGLSNFKADEVEEVIRVAKENNFVLPTVYQGNYNAVARRTETEIMPTLRKNNISFYAYSPIAGGFLTKTPEQLLAGGGGTMGPVRHLHCQNETGISQAELAYRWVAYNSLLEPGLGDGIVIGARFGLQLDQALEALERGPLSEGLATRIESLWEDIKDDSPLDNFDGFVCNSSK
ncbi:hypothetical protein N7533_002547 [Penicillium manginii]|uniref:uncharacterized protein n=1 Tax=Penicillium manginii TaxID=203109 RepID=UPI00254852CD|nr:uncharacterized protein N7533_002547 [Penicillium manginii]KAJ5763866.1 hypothetical protein N7533_002547 [Penicillium manginii]